MAFQSSGFDRAVSQGANDITDSLGLSNAQKRLSNGSTKLRNGPSTPSAYRFEKGAFQHRNNPGRVMFFQFNPESIKESKDPKYAVTQPIQSEIPIYQHISFGERELSFSLFLNGMEHPSGRSTTAIKTAPFDNKFGFLSRPIDKVADGAAAWALSRIPFAEGIGTAGGILFNKVFTSDPSPQPTENNRDVLQDLSFLDGLIHGSGTLPPPTILFDWRGYRNSAWIVTKLDQETTMWDKNQFPLHVKVDITLKEVDRDNFKTTLSNNVFLSDTFTPLI